MNITPVNFGTVNIKKCDLLDNRLLIGIDSGSSLTKVVFLHKDNEGQLFEKNIDFVTLNHGFFDNADFEDAIKWTKERAYFPKGAPYPVHITGIGTISKKEMIESILGLKVEYVDEMLTIAAGHKIALEKIGLENLVSAPVKSNFDGIFEGYLFEKFAEGIKLKFERKPNNEESSIFPCLFFVYGSLSGFFYFDENGIGQFTSCLLDGGKTFLGLAKCLLDTNNYDEIINLASTGNRENVDSQVKDIFSDSLNSPYGKFPAEMPIFAFGKGMDLDKGMEEYAKEDLALSLIAFYSLIIVIQAGHICMVRKMPKIYITGNIFRSNLFKQEMQRIWSIFPFSPNFEILDFGYFGAFGAMMCSDKEKKEYYFDELI